MSVTRRLILQKARHHPTPDKGRGSDGLSAHGFRYSFTPLPGYFSPFPHGTHPLSVTGKYSGLPGGPGSFTADPTRPLLLGKRSKVGAAFSRTGLSPSTADHPRPLPPTTTLEHYPPGR